MPWRQKIGTQIQVDDLHRHLSWLMQRYPIVRLADGIKHFRDKTLETTSVSITFDDGHIGVEKFAYGVLEKLGIPATVFLNASYIDGEDINWLIKVIHLQNEGYTRQLCDLFGISKNNLVRRLRLSPDRSVYNQLDLLEDIFKKTGMHLPQWYLGYLGRKFLREDAGKLLDIGNHGYRHIKFSWLTYEEQVTEIEKNQVALNEFDNLKRLFAVPYGMPDDWNTDTLKACKSLGLEFLSARGGINRTKEQRTEIRRTSVVPSPSLSEFFYANSIRDY